ncbi:MAG: hypothetical protein FDZ72_02945 [Betaproteobacteria bacterium]|nr:MAG: hypothetical protein FDZ72_02945 [Betaproteobacteria bacterium]
MLKATPPEQRTDFKSTERAKQLVPIEQIVKLEKQMSQVQTQYKDADENYGSDLLNLVVAKGYLTKLLGNDAVKSYFTRHESEILEHFELVVNVVSMEEAVQQQLEADGEFQGYPDSNNDQPATETTPSYSENGNETPESGGNAATEGTSQMKCPMGCHCRAAIPKGKMLAIKITFGGGDALVSRSYQAQAGKVRPRQPPPAGLSVLPPDHSF